VFSGLNKEIIRVRKYTVVKFEVSVLNANKVTALFLSAAQCALSIKSVESELHILHM